MTRFGMNGIANITHANEGVGAVAAVGECALVFAVGALGAQLFLAAMAGEFNFGAVAGAGVLEGNGCFDIEDL